MPITMQYDGMKEISDMLKDMGGKAEAIASKGLYEGAGVMANEIKKQAGTIRTEDFHYTVFGTRLPSPEEKAVVEAAGVGIAKFAKNGSEVNTSVGYRNAGYAALAGKTKPIPQIINAINSGTSFMKKQPFVRQAAAAAKAPSESAIISAIQAQVDEMNKTTT